MTHAAAVLPNKVSCSQDLTLVTRSQDQLSVHIFLEWWYF